MFKNISTIVIFIVFLISFTMLYANPNASIDEWIASQSTIRILIDPTPNYGDQTASLNVMNQLRQMGFKGKFEVLYNDLDDNAVGAEPVKLKLIKLLSLPKDIPNDYFTIHPLFGEIQLVSVANIYKQVKINPNIQPLNHVQISINGGDDFQANVIEKQMRSSVTMDITIGPYVEEPSSIFYDKWTEKKFLPESINKFYNIPVYSLQDAEKFLTTNPEGMALAQQKPALNTLVIGTKQQDFYMLPMYGSGIQWTKNEKNFTHLHNVLRIIAAVRYAQLKDQSLQTKPIILAVFYDYRPAIDVLKFALNNKHWGDNEKPGSATARKVLDELNLKNVIQFASISDNDASKRILALKPGQIMMLAMEPLPKVVFDGIYNHNGNTMLPPIREGANTLNSLILAGRSHFRCGSGEWELGYNYLMTDENFKTQFKEIIQYLCSWDEDSANWDGIEKSHWLTHPNLYQQLGDMLLATRTPQSAISRYFAQLTIEARKPENDRVRYVLEQALNVI